MILNKNFECWIEQKRNKSIFHYDLIDCHTDESHHDWINRCCGAYRHWATLGWERERGKFQQCCLVSNVTAAVSKSRVITAWASMLFNKMFRPILSYMSFSLKQTESPWIRNDNNRNKKYRHWRVSGKKMATYADKVILSLLLISICRCSFSHLHFAINNNGNRLTKLLEIIVNVIDWYRF